MSAPAFASTRSSTFRCRPFSVCNSVHTPSRRTALLLTLPPLLLQTTSQDAFALADVAVENVQQSMTTFIAKKAGFQFTYPEYWAIAIVRTRYFSTLIIPPCLFEPSDLCVCVCVLFVCNSRAPELLREIPPTIFIKLNEPCPSVSIA